MITAGRICTVHKWWGAALLLAVATGCSQQGPYVPVVNAAGEVVGRFNTQTGHSYRTPKFKPPGIPYPPGTVNQFKSLYE